MSRGLVLYCKENIPTSKISQGFALDVGSRAPLALQPCSGVLCRAGRQTLGGSLGLRFHCSCWRHKEGDLCSQKGDFFFSSCLHMLESEVQALLVRSGVSRGMEEKCQSHPGSSLQQDLVSRAMVGALKPSVFLGVVGWQDWFNLSWFILSSFMYSDGENFEIPVNA